MRGGLVVVLLLASSCLYVETTGDPGPATFRPSITCAIAMTCIGEDTIAWTERVCGDMDDAVVRCEEEAVGHRECECAVSCKPAGLCGDD